ncbi:MAG: 1,4-dihydroxy-2-naphthoate octaprenyltransferase [Bacteroidales bacterium]|nr:1,4-dihydroxy-2-naphthoate octaprenyltransferase [Bacteroidales bacterium]
MGAFKKWFLMIRPFTLSASLSPVITGLYAASLQGRLNVYSALATALCAMCLQVLSNLVNDYCDFKRGSDGPDRLGPVRAVSAGTVSPEALKRAIYITVALCVILGACLICIGGLPVLLIGVAAMFFAWLYSATSHSLSHLGISDFFTLTFYGFVASLGTTYIQTGLWSPLSFWLGLACGAIATAILTTNNIRDIEQDRKAGKKTIIVRLGTCFGKIYYLACIAVPVVILFVLKSYAAGGLIAIYGLCLYALFLKARGRGYNKILMLTGLYDLLFALSILLP